VAFTVGESIICERAFEFSVRILRLCDRLSRQGTVGRHVAWQLMRCGTSIGSNAEEAQEGQTKPDFVAKLGISRKESRETLYWLRLAVRLQIVTDEDIRWELDEARQLRSMIISAIKTAQSSSTRGR
jgi:four helix bundle protein